MNRLTEHGVLPRLLLLLLLVSLLSLSPRFHQFDREMKEAGKLLFTESDQSSSPTPGIESLSKASQHIANAAHYMPWRSDLWELAGHYALLTKDHETARQYLESAVQTGKEPCLSSKCGLSLQGWLDLGDAYQQSGDQNAAIKTWLTVLEFDGPSTELVDRLVQAYVNQKNYPYAISIMQALVSSQPDDAQLYYRLGLYTATQNPEEAMALFDKAAELEPDLEAAVSKIRREILGARISDDPAYSLLSTGRVLASLNEWELAAEAFRQATLARPDYSEAWAYLGEALQHHDNSRDSTDRNVASPEDNHLILEKALELDSKSLAAHTFLALYWERQKRYDLALQYSQSAVSLDDKNPVLQSELGRLLAVSGDLNEAYRIYSLASSLSPFDPTYQKNLVEFSMRYDYRTEETALPIARQLVIQYPDQPEYLDLIARVLIQQGDLMTAERFLERALEIDAEYAPAHLHLGLVYILQEKLEAGYRELNQAMSLAGDSPVSDQAQRLIDTYFP